MKKRVFSYLIVALCSALLTGSVAWIAATVKTTERYASFVDLQQVKTVIEENSVYEFPEETAQKNAIYGYLSALEEDRYTEYWTREEYEAYLEETQGKFSGLGLVVQSESTVTEGLFVYRVLLHSPAERAGIQVGDLITAVNGSDADGRAYSEVFNELAAGEEGQTVDLQIKRENNVFSVALQYENFVQSYVSSRIIDDVGFIRIYSFMPSAYKEFNEALDSVLKEDPCGIVIDLRNNLGGSLDAVRDILNLLIPKDEMVVLQYKNSEEVIYSNGLRKTELPIAVLINQDSASASELMASCLRDVVGAPLIGVTSYGKGIGQTTFTLQDGSAVKLTTFYYLTKGRNNYHGVGLHPDYEVTLTDEESRYFYRLTEADDPQLQKAISVLHGENERNNH